MNGVGENREANEKHDEYCFQERFQLASKKFNRDGKGGGEALGMVYCSSNIWNVLELKLDWSRKSISYFENNFPKYVVITNLSGNSNRSNFKVCDVLYWVIFNNEELLQ